MDITQLQSVISYAKYFEYNTQVLKALVNSLSAVEQAELLNQPIFDYEVLSYIKSLLNKKSEDTKTNKKIEKPKRNRSFSKLIKDYNTHGSREKAREELAERLQHLTFGEQRKAVRILLSGKKVDREIAYRFLAGNWDAVYEKEIEEAFESSGDMWAAQLITDRCDTSYVIEHLEELKKLCYSSVRLRIPSTEPIDRAKVSNKCYLYLLAKLHLTAPEDDIAETFYRILWKYLSIYDIRLDLGQKYESPLQNELLKSSIWCIGELKQTQLLLDIASFDGQCRKQFVEEGVVNVKKVLVESIKGKPYAGKFQEMLSLEIEARGTQSSRKTIWSDDYYSLVDEDIENSMYHSERHANYDDIDSPF